MSRNIRSRMQNKAHLSIGNAQTIGLEDPLHCYEGMVDYGNNEFSVDATIMAFQSSTGESAKTLCNQLSSVSSQYVMNFLLFEEGANDYVAFPRFQETYASYIEKESTETVAKGRLSETFIELTRDLIEGIETLHQAGYYCPNFKGQHVAVMREAGRVVPKIWSFCVAEGEEAKIGDWARLADKIDDAALNHGISSLEIQDLIAKMRSGELKGSETFQHSALLTVLQKFDQIVALNLYVEIYFKGQEQLPYGNDPKKTQIHAELVNFLMHVSNWASDTPKWIETVNLSRKRPPPTLENGYTFIFEIRSMIEHRNLYAPPGTNEELPGELESNLELEVRTAWEEGILKVLNFATDLGVKY